MGEAKRRNALGLPPRSEKFEIGVSRILEGQTPLTCGDCKQEVIPQAMIFFGQCGCGSSVGSCHAPDAFTKVHSFRGAFLGFLMSLAERLLPPDYTDRAH